MAPDPLKSLNEPSAILKPSNSVISSTSNPVTGSLKVMVIGTGETHSVKEFLTLAFEALDLNYPDYLVIDKKLFRPSEVNLLLSNNTKAKNKLNWQSKITFKELVKEMVLSDFNDLKNSSN